MKKEVEDGKPTNHFSRLQLGSQLWFRKRDAFPLKVASIVKSFRISHIQKFFMPLYFMSQSLCSHRASSITENKTMQLIIMTFRKKEKEILSCRSFQRKSQGQIYCSIELSFASVLTKNEEYSESYKGEGEVSNYLVLVFFLWSSASTDSNNQDLFHSSF